jgi:hypothetical protein
VKMDVRMSTVMESMARILSGEEVKKARNVGHSCTCIACQTVRDRGRCDTQSLASVLIYTWFAVSAVFI